MQNPLSGMQSFIFGANTDSPTYESLKKRREIADLLAAQATTGTPRNVGEGINAIGQALASRYIDKKIGPKEDAERQSITEALAGLTGEGYSGGGFTGAGMSSMGAPAATGQPMPPQGQPVSPAAGGGNYRDAIASIESAGSGDYSAMGPTTKTGDRAYGRYQVMGANIPEWTQEALGQQMTPDQFLQNPEIQDKVFDHRFGGYVDQYGPQGAASMWFSGDPTPDGSSDQLGTSDSDYVNKFMGALGGGGQMIGGGQPDMGKVAQIAEILSNPYATEGQQMVAKALIERELSQGGGGITPYQAAQLGMDQQRLQLDRDKFAQGTREGPKFYGNPIWGKDETGNWTLGQLGSDGQFHKVDVPEGFQPDPGGIKVIDQGTQSTIADRSGAPIGAVPKDVAGVQAQQVLGDTQGQAAAGLPDFELQVGQASELIDRIINAPALGNAAGVLQSRLPTVNQDTANVEADVEQLRSQVFPMAIQALKGLGAMSNMEGDAFAKSVASLDLRRDPKAVIAELNRLKGVLAEKLEIAKQKAAGASGGAPQSAIDAGVDPSLFEFMSPEERALWK